MQKVSSTQVSPLGGQGEKWLLLTGEKKEKYCFRRSAG
jgi:hypothetical protein